MVARHPEKEVAALEHLPRRGSAVRTPGLVCLERVEFDLLDAKLRCVGSCPRGDLLTLVVRQHLSAGIGEQLRALPRAAVTEQIERKEDGDGLHITPIKPRDERSESRGYPASDQLVAAAASAT